MQINKATSNIGFFGLMMASITCIIGSGWLFGAYQAAKIAGPSAIYAWIIGGVAMLLIALNYVELGSMLPRTGGMVRYLDYTHGSLAGFINAWANWLAIATYIPVEAVASIQYLSSWPFPWAHKLFDMQSQSLTTSGLIAASALMIVYFLLNYWSIRLFIRSIIFITVIKIITPILTLVLLAMSAFHPSNFHAYHGTVAPYGWSAVLTAIATSGIVFAYNGFQTIVNLAGEVKNPSRTLPLAIIFSLVFALVIYVALQVVFIGSIDPKDVLHGWHTLNFSSPFVELALILNLHMLAILLYADAFISPSGTGITYLASTSRMLFAMAETRYMPAGLAKLHPKYQIPRRAMWVNLGTSFIFLWLFKGWAHLVPIVSLTAIIAYLSSPIAVMALRRLAPGLKRPVLVPGLKYISLIAFIIISWVFYWARWPLTGEVMFILLIGLVFYVYFQTKQGWPDFGQQLKSGLWLIGYLVMMAMISYLGSNKFGGINVIPFGWDMFVVAVIAGVCYFWGIKSAWINLTSIETAISSYPIVGHQSEK